MLLHEFSVVLSTCFNKHLKMLTTCEVLKRKFVNRMFVFGQFAINRTEMLKKLLGYGHLKKEVYKQMLSSKKDCKPMLRTSKKKERLKIKVGNKCLQHPKQV